MLLRSSKRWISSGAKKKVAATLKGSSITSPDESLLLLSGCGMGINYNSVVPSLNDGMKVLSWHCHLNDRLGQFRWKITAIAEADERTWFQFGPSYAFVFYRGPPCVFKGYNDTSQRVLSGAEIGWGFITTGSVLLASGVRINWTTINFGIQLGRRDFKRGKIGTTGNVRRRPRWLMQKPSSIDLLFRIVSIPAFIAFVIASVWALYGKIRLDNVVGDDAELRDDIEKLKAEAHSQYRMGNSATGRYLSIMIEEILARKRKDTEAVEMVKEKMSKIDVDSDRCVFTK